ncbi:unnamed protein product, partial [Symbiodinium necroappetens]
RARRRELVLNKALPPSAIDEALADQLMLVASQRHNDMVLCCPASPAVMPATPSAARPLASCASTPPKAQRGREGSPKSGIGISEESPGSDEVPDPKRQELLEKESRRLRIENAELKKRLQFGSEFLKQENRRLRVENAELKKRLYFAGPYAQGTSSVPIWVPVPVMAASPNCGSPNSGAARGTTMSAGCGSGQVSPGTGTPATPAQGSGTPIQHGFWVPLARNAVGALSIGLLGIVRARCTYANAFYVASDHDFRTLQITSIIDGDIEDTRREIVLIPMPPGYSDLDPKRSKYTVRPRMQNLLDLTSRQGHEPHWPFVVDTGLLLLGEGWEDGRMPLERFPLHQIRQTGSTQLSFPVVARGGSVLIASSFDTRMSGEASLRGNRSAGVDFLGCLSAGLGGEIKLFPPPMYNGELEKWEDWSWQLKRYVGLYKPGVKLMMDGVEEPTL